MGGSTLKYGSNRASTESINAYIKALESKGIVAKVHRSRGKDIYAACGQLANKEA